jgi:hypothetical protein
VGGTGNGEQCGGRAGEHVSGVARWQRINAGGGGGADIRG